MNLNLPRKIDFEEHLHHYKSQHESPGCKITHMIGIPMIAISFLVLPFNRKAFIQLQLGGWALQFIGHFLFEKNKPVFMRESNPLTIGSALVFCAQEWKNAFKKSFNGKKG